MCQLFRRTSMRLMSACKHAIHGRTRACDEGVVQVVLFALGVCGMAKELFGTDGIRGTPGEYPLDDTTLVRVGLALGDFLRKKGERSRVLIGRDTRESGPHIAERIARGLETAGAEPVSAGVLTTPGVAWLVHCEGFSAGRGGFGVAQSVPR